VTPETGAVRLQKVLADRGVASRRNAETLMREGRVKIGGQIVRELGTRVPPDARIEVDGRAVPGQPARRYVVLNKPRGIVSTAHDERGRPNVVELLGARERLYPVGRLDEESEGLLLLTNDGAWAERVLHPRNGHEREYEVTVAGHVPPGAIAALRRGVRLDEGIARASRVSVSGGARGATLRIVVHTGWKRQVRRMCGAVGLRVVRLRRVRLGPLELGRLRPGAWRELTPREVRALGGG
jgi:23S rRNA pseudouridine2605 synthase